MTNNIYVNAIVLSFLIVIIIFAFWTDSNLEYLIYLLKGTHTNIPIWISFLLNLLVSGFALVFNIVMEIIKMAN